MKSDFRLCQKFRIATYSRRSKGPHKVRGSESALRFRRRRGPLHREQSRARQEAMGTNAQEHFVSITTGTPLPPGSPAAGIAVLV